MTVHTDLSFLALIKQASFVVQAVMVLLAVLSLFLFGTALSLAVNRGTRLLDPIVAARFNDLIVRNLVDGAVDALKRHGAAETDIHVVRVPGAFAYPAGGRRGQALTDAFSRTPQGEGGTTAARSPLRPGPTAGDPNVRC